MPALLLASPQPLSGKTAVAVGLAQRLSDEGHSVALLRLAGDEHAEQDSALFASLPINVHRHDRPVEPSTAAGVDADYVLVEAPAGDPAAVLTTLGGAVTVARYSPSSDSIVEFCRSLGSSLTALVVTCVPASRQEAVREALLQAGLPLLTLVPEDRTLAAPTLADAAAVLEAGATHLNDNRHRLLDRPLIASISADPGQGYFARYNPSAVIVRSDKPDLQLAALNAGAPCLILTGGLTPLSYVVERAEEEEIPLLETALGTVAAVQRLEALYSATPFCGPAKVERIAQLLAGADLTPLTQTK